MLLSGNCIGNPCCARFYLAAMDAYYGNAGVPHTPEDPVVGILMLALFKILKICVTVHGTSRKGEQQAGTM